MARQTHVISPFKVKDHYRAWMALQEVIDEVGTNQLPCAQAPELYHPSNNEKYYMELARTACFGCPIQNACATYAIKYEKEGIWGGMSANQRLKIRRAGK